MTNPQGMLEHISNETLAAFGDGRLHGAERRAAIEHLADCDECRDDLLAIGEAEDLGVIEPGGEVVAGNFVRRATIAALAAAAVIAIVFLSPVREKIEFYRTGGVSELVKASEHLKERSTQARLAGGFPYKTFSTKRGTPDEKSREYALEAAAWRVKEKGSARGAGVANLLLGERDEAVASLDRAVASNPKDPLLLSDCAAAHIERSRYGGDEAAHARDLELARELADRAWAMKKTPEIAWNRALARELSYRPDAAQAWRDYLQLDPASPWAKEARSHLSEE